VTTTRASYQSDRSVLTRAAVEKAVYMAGGLALGLANMTAVDDAITSGEAARWMGSLSDGINSLDRLCNLLEERSPRAKQPMLRDATDAGLELAQLRDLDRSQVPALIESLRVKERQVRELRTRLESMLAGEERRCEQCGDVMGGRPDRRYCGATCRQRANRAARQPSS
jgi:hypothetical protein